MLYVLLTYLCWPLLRLAPRRRAAAPPRRYLVVQTAKIGDLVYATGMWRAIKAAQPDAHVALLAHPATAPLVEHDPALDAIHTIDAAGLRRVGGKRRLGRLVRAGGYDAALCLTPSLGLAVGLLWGLVPRVVLLVPDVAGGTFRLVARLASRVEHRRGEPLSAAYGRMLTAAGIAGDTRTRALVAAPESSARVGRFLAERRVTPGALLVGIAPATGNPVKQWAADRVAALADLICTWPDAQPVLIGSAADRPLIEAILTRVGSGAREVTIDAAGAFPLEDLPSLIWSLNLVVAGDSGPLHIAEAMGVPAVIIGGPADLRERDLRTEHALVQKDLPCLPCVSAFAAPYTCPLGHHRCLQETEVGEVWAAVRAMLERIGRPALPAVQAGA
jgi:ADP-heptose:LPS heptosyltransferase